MVLDSSGNGAFGGGDLQYAFGKAGDAYVIGDWNADGRTEIGVVRNGSTWLLDASGNGVYGAGDRVYTFGKSGDVPVSGNWARTIPQPSVQPSVTITFNRDLTITPGTTVEIPAGGKVIWKNDDPFKPHGVVAVDNQTGKYFGGMNPVAIPYGNTFQVTFDAVGSFYYNTVFPPETGGTVMVI